MVWDTDKQTELLLFVLIILIISKETNKFVFKLDKIGESPFELQKNSYN